MSEYTDLIELMQNKPDELRQLFVQNAELRKRVIEWGELAEAGESVTAGGFAKFYEKLYSRPLPKIMEPVAEEFAWAYKNRKGVMLEAWRGIGKSTFFTAWGPYVIGVNPVGSTALIRINDDKAKEMGSAIATIIETNPAWQQIFPHVVPDKQSGWSVENGLEVMDTRITNGSEGYAKWQMAKLADHLSEKSLVCNGVESGSNIGLHPTNGEWFDDLHDERNTRSLTEMKRVVDIVEANFIPTWFSAGGSPTIGVFCTPWSKNPKDGYQAMLQTGMFKHIKIPLFKESDDGVEIPATTQAGQPVDSDWAGKRVVLTWPEQFPIEKVAEIIHANKTRFGQMYLLNVELSKPRNMRYQEFDEKDIQVDRWPMLVGVDPVGWVKGVSSGQGISHFAAVQFLKTPYNFLVVYDGLVEKIDGLEGEKRIAEWQRIYARTYERASVEMNGAGAMWIAMITRTSGIKYHAHKVSELGEGKKKDRQYRFLQPLFAAGAIKVSTGNTPFLNAVREYLDIFPNFDETSYLADVGDALCIGALDCPEIWTRVVVDSAHETIWPKKRETVDPYRALAHWNYLK